MTITHSASGLDTHTLTVKVSGNDCPSGQPAAAFWTACLTAGYLDATGTGYLKGVIGTLDPATVSYGGNSYNVDGFSILTSGLALSFESDIGTTVTAGWRLSVGSTEFALASASYHSSGGTFTWSSHSLSWSSGDKVSVSLRAADTTSPTVSAAEVTEAAPKEVLLTFGEALATGSVPDKSAFAVKIDGSAGPGVSSVAIDGDDATKLKLGLAYMLTAGDSNVTVDYTKPGSSPLKDADDNEVATFTGQEVTNNAPACPGGQPADAFWTACLTVADDSGGVISGFFGSNGSLSPATFTRNETSYEIDGISEAGEVLGLSFTADPRPASESWILQVGSLTYRLDAKDSYTTSRHTYVWNVAGFDWANPNIGDKVSVSLRPATNNAPTASNNTVETKEETAYTFDASDFNFSDTDSSDALEAVKVTSLPGSGKGTLTLDGTAIDSTDLPKAVTKTEIDDDKLKYTPPADANGASYAAFQFKVNDGDDDSALAYTMTIDVDSVPDITQVAVSSAPRSGTTPKKYGASEQIGVKVTFDEAVTVTGDPVINVEVGSNSRPAAYASGSGTTALVFRYTVVSGDSDSDGISINANALTLDSDDKIEGSDNDTADITHAAHAAQSAHKVDGSLTPPKIARRFTLTQTAYTVSEGERLTVIAEMQDSNGNAAALEADLKFGIRTIADTAGASVDYTAISEMRTLSQGDTRVEIEVQTTEDTLFEENERFFIQLQDSDAPDLTTQALTIDTSASTITITDDDSLSPVLDKTAITLDEGGTAQYTVKLDAVPPATGVTTVRIVSGDEGAATVNPDSLSFTTSTWSTAQEVTVTGVEDRDVQDETVTLTYMVVHADSNTLVETTLSTGTGPTVTVNDDDDPAIVVSKESVAVDEGGTGTYTVRLDVRPNVSVTVNIASGDTGVATVSPASLTFTTSTWNVERDVTVTGVQDGDSDGETATITHSATGLEDVEVGVTVNDDDSGACPSGQPASAFWKACLTVAKSALGFYGFEAGLSGTLSDDDFTFRGENISISKLTYEASIGLELDFTEDLKGSTDMVLQVGSTSLNVPAGTDEFTWSSPGFTWGDTNVGDKVSVSLRLKENTDVDVTAPVLQSATIDGTKLVLTYDERLLSESGNVDAGAFTVEVSGRDQPLTGSTDLVDVADDGTRVIVTLAGAVGPNDRVTVSYNRVLGAAGRIRDLSGNLAASFFDRSVKNLGNWSGSPVLHVEVEEGGSATFEWTPPGTPTEQLPVKLNLVQHRGTSPAIDLASSKQTLTSKTPGRFKLYGVHDDDWKDEVVHLSVFARRGEGRFRHIGMVNVTVRDDDGVAPGGSGGCAAATGSPFWSACMRVGSGSGDKGFEGLRPWQAQSSTSPPFGGLSKATVDRDGTHVIDGIVDHGSGNGGLSVSFVADPRPVANSWVVRLGSRIFSFSDAGYYHLPRNGALRVSHTHSYHWNYGSNESGQGWSGGDKVTVSLFDFPKPTGVSAAPGDRQATLTWTAPESVEPITGWQLRHGPTGAEEGETASEDAEPEWGEWTAIEDATAGTAEHTVTGLENGAEYAFELRALAGALVGEASVRRLARPDEEVIPPFVDSAVSSVTATTVGLEWTLPEMPEGMAATRLRAMQREKGATGEWQAWQDAAELAVDATSTTVTGLAPATLYQFHIVVETARQSADSGLLQQQTRAFDPLDTRMAGTVPDSDDGTLREGPPAQGCRVDVELRFLDADGNAVAVDALAATDFTVENGRAGTPVVDAEGLSWTVPARATTNERGLVRVRLTETGRWRAAEQVFHNRGAGVCATAARGELATLRIEELSISPSFSSTTTSYTAETTDEDAEVVAEAIYADAAVTIAPVDADEETDGHQLALAEGETGVTVTVTPGDGSAAQTYTVTVTREATATVLTGFVLVDASTDADLGAVSDGGTVTVSANGSYGIRAETQAGAEVGSVVLSLAGPGETDTHTQTESIAPYSLYGDAPGGTNGRAEHGRALAAGSYTLTATAYALSGGAGEALGTLTAAFTVAVETAPPPAGVLTGFTLVDASDGSTVAALANGADIDLGGRSGGSFAIRADVASDATVGSVALSLSGAKTVSRTENCAPWSLWGDRDDGNGGRALDGAALPAGTYTLSATAHAERRATGSTLGTLSVSFEVLSPAALSVADARAEEGTDATLDFAVALDRSSTGTVTVDYATSDGTATAGSDYTATSGTLTFAPGDTSKTVSVPVLEDDHDEGSETLTLRLTHVQGARIADGEATGTITNWDATPKAWLARFGRTVTGQVLDAVEARLAAPRAAGAEASVAGLSMPSWRGGDGASPGTVSGAGDDASAGSFPAEAEDREALASMTAWLSQTGSDSASGAGFGVDGTGREPESHALTQRDLIVGTSFALTGGSAEGGGFASLWGRGSIAGFDGREGSLTVDGEVTTALVGADWASDSGSGSGVGRWTAGLALGHSTGTGGWRGANGAGAIEAVLTGLYPYAGIDLTERLSVWAAAGHGAGEVTVTPEGESGLTADLSMAMGAAGVRSDVLRPGEGNGLALAVKGDARFTRTSSDAVRGGDGNLAASEADAWLLRTGLEGARPVALDEGGATLTPTFELGLRLDGGDAETGMGADLGGDLAFADPGSGVALDLRARGLVVHESPGFREWGASLQASWDPRPSTDRGLSLSLSQSWGASPAGGIDALLGRETLAGLAADDDAGRFEVSSRLEGELGYGLPAFGGAFTGTPNVGIALSDGGAREWRLGWRLSSAIQGDSGFEVGLDATRSEPANDDARPEHGVMLRGTVRW